MYTIRSELGTVNGQTITLLGDLKNGRTVHSLVTLLCLYKVRLNFVAPASLTMPTSVVNAARRAGAYVRICDSLEEVLSETDVLYVTRVQKERFESEEDWVRVKDAYRVDQSVLSRAKEDMIIMHPLPRVNGKRHPASQIDDTIQTDPTFPQKSTPRLTSTRAGLCTSDKCATVYLYVPTALTDILLLILLFFSRFAWRCLQASWRNLLESKWTLDLF